MPWLNHHPYLVESVVLLLLALGLLFTLPRPLWSLGLLGGILSTPFALLSSLHVPDFWQPEFIGCKLINPEDVIWCAAAGLNIWIIALWPRRHNLEWRWRWPQSLLRYLLVGIAGLLLHWPVLQLLRGPAGAMPATLFALLITGAAVALRLGPSERSFIGWPSLIYAAYHWLDVRAFFYFWPHTRDYWNPVAQLPFTVFGTPAYEILWALCFGLAWPALMVFVCHVRLTPRTPSPSG